jgi:hypothetical protein
LSIAANFGRHSRRVLRKLEAVQRTFTYRISSMRELNPNYWGRLKHLEQYSQEEKRKVYHTVHLEVDNLTGSQL